MVNESRIFKRAKFISKNYDFEKVILLGIWKNGISKNQILEDKVQIKRISLLNIQNRKILYMYYFIYISIYVLINRPSLVNIHTLEFLPILLIAKIFKIKIVYDPHELETEKSNLKGLRKKLSKWLEYLLIKKVDHTFVVSNNIANWYYKNYDISRPTVIFNTPKFQHLKKNDYFRKKFTIRDDQLIFLYQGGLAEGRGIELLIDYFKNRKDDRAIIIFMGYGIFEKKICNESKLCNTIFFHNAVNPSILMQYTSSADIGIAMIKNTSLSYDYCMPNKLFEYTMAGLPVIVSDVKEMSEFVQSNNIGLVVKNNEIESLNYAVNKMISKDLNTFKANIKRVASQNTWEQQESKMIKVYKNLLC